MTEKDTMQVKPEKKEDRRVRRTKKLLTHGLIQLMKEKQVQDITVRELADLVDVNRGTFYLYYRDIFDMLDSIEQELFNQVNQLIAAHKGETVLTHTLPVLKFKTATSRKVIIGKTSALINGFTALTT